MDSFRKLDVPAGEGSSKGTNAVDPAYDFPEDFWERAFSPNGTFPYKTGEDAKDTTTVVNTTASGKWLTDLWELFWRLTITECSTARDFTSQQKRQVGQLGDEGEIFTPLVVIKKYPYTSIGNENRQKVWYTQAVSLPLLMFEKVAEAFFDQGKLMENNTWDL